MGGAGRVGGDRGGGGGPRPGDAGASSTSAAAARGRPRRRGRRSSSPRGSADPISEFFAVTLEGPGPLRRRRAAVVLDSLLDGLTRAALRARGGLLPLHQRHHVPQPGPPHPPSSSSRSTCPRSDSAGALVPAGRAARCGRPSPRVPDGPRYSALVTGRAPLDLDVRTVVTRRQRRGEQALLPLTLIILVLAFGALVAAVLPLIVGFLAIAISLAIIGADRARHADVGVRAQHDDDDRPGRRHRLLAADRDPVPGGAEPGLPRGARRRSTRS